MAEAGSGVRCYRCIKRQLEPFTVSFRCDAPTVLELLCSSAYSQQQVHCAITILVAEGRSDSFQTEFEWGL